MGLGDLNFYRGVLHTHLMLWATLQEHCLGLALPFIITQVDTLTARVTELEAELSRKEMRWNTTHTRLKDRAEGLENEGAQLRAQVCDNKQFL